MDNLKEKKESLIELIDWYRDEYHKNDFCHAEMIDKISKIKDEKEFLIYEQFIDGWLD